jgi:glutamate/tyrosine decarboxylase-like PLP-dependent enzyme
MSETEQQARSAVLDRLSELEKDYQVLEPDMDTFRAWRREVDAYAEQFLHEMPKRPAWIGAEQRPEGYDRSHFSFSEHGRSIKGSVDEIRQKIEPGGLDPASGGHLAYIPGGGLLPSALGDYLADVTNRYSGVGYGGAGATRMEDDLVRWLCDLVGYDEQARGSLLSGGSIATLSAMAAAKQAFDVQPEDLRKLCIYLSEQTHHCVQKSMRLTGLEYCNYSKTKLNEAFEIDTKHLREQIRLDKEKGLKPFLLIANAGTTDTGAIDPIEEMAEIAREESMWLHVDAAYGGCFLLVNQLRSRMAGINQADSVVLDPHKGMFLPYGTGAVLVKEGRHLQNAHRYKAAYLQDAAPAEDLPDPAELSPELTRPFRGLRMWLPMQLFGLKAFRAALEEKHLLCVHFFDRIKALGFETGPPPPLSVCMYRWKEAGWSEAECNEFNKKLLRRMLDDGRIFLSSTTTHPNKYWIRLAVLSFRTHLSHIELCLELLEQFKNELLEQQ